MPMRRAERGAAQDGLPHAPEILLRRHQTPDLAGEHLARFLGFEVGDDLGDAEQAHGHADEADPVGEFQNAEREAQHARVDVGADQAEQQAEQHHRNRLEQRAVRQDDGSHQAEHHQREVLGGAELQRDFGQRRGEHRHDHGGDAAGEERTDRRGRERRTRPALTRHLVAIEAGHDRGRLARDVDQDRRRRAAVLRAVIDAGEHDQRGDRARGRR